MEQAELEQAGLEQVNLEKANLERAALAAAQAFVAGHADTSIQRFMDNVMSWGEEQIAVPSAHLPVSETFMAAESDTPDLNALMAPFKAMAECARWEQSYTQADGLVGDDMLAGYGFIELVGKLGPFVSNKVRLGVGAWGPHIKYPAHHHAAEEIYLVLAGSAWFELEGDAPAQRAAGDVVYVRPSRVHALHTRDEPVVVFYLWQGGDLRERSNFTT